MVSKRNEAIILYCNSTTMPQGSMGEGSNAFKMIEIAVENCSESGGV